MPSGVRASAWGGIDIPFNDALTFPEATSHSWIVFVSVETINIFPSGANTSAACVFGALLPLPRNTERPGRAIIQSRMLSPPTANTLLSGEKATARVLDGTPGRVVLRAQVDVSQSLTFSSSAADASTFPLGAKATATGVLS